MRAKTADSMVFLAPQGEPPIADPHLHRCLDLAMVTAAPPRNFQTGQDYELSELMHEIVRFREAIDAQTSLLVVDRPNDLLVDGATKLVLGLQNVPTRTDKAALQALRQLGIQVMGVAYDHQNHLGGGFMHPSYGLTDEGCRFVEDCVELGIVLDVSHASHFTASQVVDLVRLREGNVMASHGGIYELYRDPRNLPGSVLESVAAAKGLVGVYTLTFGLDAVRDDAGVVLDHLTRAIEICGSQHVCLGSDAVYQQMDIEQWQAKFAWMQERIDPDGTKGSRWPDFPLELNGPTARLNGVRAGLAERHFNEEIIDSVMGQNLFDFFRRTLR